MAVLLNYVFGDGRPLRAISEHVSRVPREGLKMRTAGWPKVLYFFDGNPDVVLGDGTVYQVQPGDTLVLSDGCESCFFAAKGAADTRMHVLAIFFDPPERTPTAGDSRHDLELENYLRFTFSENLHLASRHSWVLWQQAVRLRGGCESPRIFHKNMACELALQFVFHLAEFAGRQAEAKLPECDRMVRSAGELMLTDGRTSSPSWPRDLARQLGVSSSLLNRAFLECTGLTVPRYFMRDSLERAKLKLLESNVPVYQVAKSAHFGSTSAFCRAFKSGTGYTPKGYRQAHDGSPLIWNDPALVARIGLWGEEFQIKDSRVRTIPFPSRIKVSSSGLVVCLRGRLLLEHPRRGSIMLRERRMVALGAGQVLKCTLAPGVESGEALLLEGSLSPKDADKIFARLAHGIFCAFQTEADLNLLRARLAEGCRDAHGKLIVRSLCQTLWIEALREVRDATGAPSGRKQTGQAHRLLLNHAREFMQKNICKHLSLDMIAYAVGVSGEHLARVFRAEAGKTVMKYFYEARVYEAQKLLVKSDTPIAEIVELSGFSTVAHFYRTFKQTTGCSPAEFRARGIAALP